MFPTARLTAFLTLVLVASATPIVPSSGSATLKLTKHINSKNFVKADRSRVNSLISRAGGRPPIGTTSTASAAAAPTSTGAGTGTSGSAPIEDQSTSYTASIGVGSQTFEVIIDTGSSNTWIGAQTPYQPGDTSTNTGNPVSVSYGSGSFTGIEYIDTVTLGSLTVQNQSIGVAGQGQAEGFNQGVDGLLGIGPTDLTEDTVEGVDTVPTFTDSLFAQGSIPINSVAISFEPVTSGSNATANGELTFGGTDSSKFTGSITYTPITTTQPASNFWGIDQTISYGDSPILTMNAGIVDTGTTLIYIASDAYTQYMSASGATEDDNTGLLTVTADQFAKLQSLVFNIGGANFELTPNAQLWPRSLNSMIGGTDDGYYLIVSDLGTNSGQGLDFINGYAFLERFYSVFDTTNNQFGIANTQFTNATTN